MAQIDLGKFGQAAPVVRSTPIAPSGIGVEWAAARNLGETGMSLADQMLNDYSREQKHLQGAKIQYNSADFGTEAAKRSLAEVHAMEAGEITPEQAVERYRMTMADVKVPEIDGLDEAMSLQYQTAIKQQKEAGELRILNAMGRVAEKQQNQTAAAFVDSTVRNAIVSEYSDTAEAALRTSAAPGGLLYRAYGKEKAEQILADSISSIRYGRTLRTLADAEDKGKPEVVEGVLTSLRDGQSDLSRDLGLRHPQLLGYADTTLRQIKSRAEQQTNRVEAGGERATHSYERDLRYGVTIPPERREEYRLAAIGTKSWPTYQALSQMEPVLSRAGKATFDGMAADIEETAKSLTAAMEGGNTESARLYRDTLTNLLELANNRQNMRATAPLEFVESLTGEKMADLVQADFAPGGALKAKLKDRENAILGHRKAEGYGNRYVPMLLLKKDDAVMVGGMLQQGTPDSRIATLQIIMDAAENRRDIYQSILAQSLPEKGSVAIAVAGMRVTAKDQEVGRAILQGHDLLYPKGRSKDTMADAKHMEDDPPSKYLDELKTSANDIYKAMLPGESDALVEAARCYRAARPQVDILTAIKRVAGDVMEASDLKLGFSGKLMVPWGMSRDDFSSKMITAYFKALGEKRITIKERNEATRYLDDKLVRSKDTQTAFSVKNIPQLPNSRWAIFEAPGSAGLRYNFYDTDSLKLIKDNLTDEPVEISIEP